MSSLHRGAGKLAFLTSEGLLHTEKNGAQSGTTGPRGLDIWLGRPLGPPSVLSKGWLDGWMDIFKNTIVEKNV